MPTVNDDVVGSCI